MRVIELAAQRSDDGGRVSQVRVLIVTPLWPTEGSYAGRQVETLANSLAMQGLQVHVAVIEGRSDLKYFREARQVHLEAKRFGADVLMAVYAPTAIACMAVRDVPKLVYLLGSDVNKTRVRRLSKLFVGSRAGVVAVSESLADRWGSERVQVIPNGVEPDIFRPGDGMAAKAALGFDSSPLIMFAGVPSVPTKNYARFRAVLEVVRQDRAGFVQAVEPSGRNTADEIAHMLRAADVVLLTSDRGTEGSPTIVKEALLCGTPVVSVDVGDVYMWATEPYGTVVPWTTTETQLVDRLASAVCRHLDALPQEPPVNPRATALRTDVVASRWRALMMGQLKHRMARGQA